MTSSRPSVVVSDPFDVSALERLRASGLCEVVDASASAEALEAALPNAWALVVRSRTKVTGALLAKAPKLAYVGRAGVGVDNVDLPAAEARGVKVFNAPAAATDSVAELTVALLLMLARDLPTLVQGTKAGSWPKAGLGTELSGKTVGFIGYGRIARETAKRLTAFGVRILAHDPFVSTTSDGTTLLPLDALLAGSDYVSLHAALTKENHHLLNAARIATMKRGARVVNVARGPLVDEAALLSALESGALGGAALDVFETEPPTRTALLQHPKVIPTPHIGAATKEGQARAGSHIVEELLRALRGEALTSLVAPPPGAAPR